MRVMVDDQPATVPRAFQVNRMRMMKAAPSSEMRKPSRVTSRSGTIEKLETPFQAKASIFFSGYLVVPAVRGVRL